MVQSKVTDLLEKVPYPFWVLIAVALAAGLISLVAMKAYYYIDGQKIDADYPVYEKIMLENGNAQPDFYKKIQGAYYLRENETETIVELYSDGYFAWEAIDSTRKYIKLFAAGRYAQNQEGQIVFSQMQKLGLPFDRKNPALKIYHMKLNETAFSFKIKKEDKTGAKMLALNIPENPEQIHPALKSFLQAVSAGKQTVSLKYLGTPSGRLRNELKR
ncbi:MAG: hypothetical protein ACPG05_02820 [Bdellovibrionales bacterium]